VYFLSIFFFPFCFLKKDNPKEVSCALYLKIIEEMAGMLSKINTLHQHRLFLL